MNAIPHLMAARSWGPYRAVVTGIHDGDTIDVSIVLSRPGKLPADHDLGFNIHRTPEGVVLTRQAVRLWGCNAPELSTAAGKRARAFIGTLLTIGAEVTLVSRGWDKYGGRIDGSVTLADGRDLVDTMIAAGHAVAWGGVGPKPV